MALDNIFNKPPTMPTTLPKSTTSATPTSGTIAVKTVEPSITEIKKVNRYEEGTSPLLYCTDVLSEYGQESDIPVNHDYWEIKRRIK